MCVIVKSKRSRITGERSAGSVLEFYFINVTADVVFRVPRMTKRRVRRGVRSVRHRKNVLLRGRRPWREFGPLPLTGKRKRSIFRPENLFFAAPTNVFVLSSSLLLYRLFGSRTRRGSRPFIEL